MTHNIDIFNIPLYYIGFKKSPELETHLKNHKFKNINHFSAIDGRKYTPIDLLEKNTITIRTYNDLIYGRHHHTGMPTIGGIGCTLSHFSLWTYCVDNNLPYIIILEDDARIKNNLTDFDINNIKKSLEKKNGGFVSTNNLKKNNEYFFGLHFYIITNGCAKNLVKYCFPIDVQTDVYVNNLNNRGHIEIEGYQIASQKIHKSSIQTLSSSFICMLPKNISLYLFILLVIVIIIIIVLLYNYKKLYYSKF